MNNSSLLYKLERFDSYLTNSIKVICVTLMILIIFIVSLSVFTRFLFFYPLNFSSPLSKYIMVWLSFLGIGLAAQKGEHIAVDMLLRKTSGKSETFLLVIIDIIVSIFLIVVTYFGFIYAFSGRNSSDPMVFELNMMIPYLALPIGTLYTLVQYNLYTVIQILRKKERI